MSKKIIIVLAAVVILAAAAGFFFSGEKEVFPQKATITKLSESSLVKSWFVSVYGEIAAAADGNITVTSEGKSMVIPVKTDAQINAITILEQPKVGESLKTKSAPIQFSDIAVGKNASIFVEIKADGGLAGANVSVFNEAAVQQ